MKSVKSAGWEMLVLVLLEIFPQVVNIVASIGNDASYVTSLAKVVWTFLVI